jgi:hypothetical protein
MISPTLVNVGYVSLQVGWTSVVETRTPFLQVAPVGFCPTHGRIRFFDVVGAVVVAKFTYFRNIADIGRVSTREIDVERSRAYTALAGVSSTISFGTADGIVGHQHVGRARRLGTGAFFLYIANSLTGSANRGSGFQRVVRTAWRCARTIFLRIAYSCTVSANRGSGFQRVDRTRCIGARACFGQIAVSATVPTDSFGPKESVGGATNTFPGT